MLGCNPTQLRRGLLAAVGVTAVIAGGAGAQDGVERITVTTTRTSVDWLSRADGVARFEEDAIDLVDADHPAELLNRAPGVALHRGSGVEHLTAIRSPVLTGGAGAGSFLYLEDGVPLRAAGFANVNGLFEGVSELAQSVEVVRGPGSVLYGSNAVHGTINIMTPTPNSDRTAFEISASTLDRNKLSLEASRTRPGGGIYAGVSVLDEGGWREEADVGQQKAVVRWDTSSGPWSAATTFAFTNLNQETAGFAVGDSIYKNSSLSRVNLDANAYRDAKAARLQSRIAWERSDTLSFALTPYARWNEMEFLQHFLPGDPLEETGHTSVGALATAYWQASSRVNIVTGVDLEWTDGFLSEFQDAPSFGVFPQGSHYDYDIVATTAAAYADADIALSDDWSAQVGARVESTRYEYDNQTAADTVGRFRRPADRTDTFDTVTPTAALLRRFGDTSVAYVRYARGARAPQTTDAYRLQNNQTVGEIEPETLDSVEIGWRGQNDILTWDVAAFAMEKEHFFFRDADGLNVPNGETRHRGVEAQITVPLAEFLEASLAGTYARHTYEFDRPANGIVSGTDMDTAPRWLANGQLRWLPTDALEFEAEWVHVDEYFVDEGASVIYPGHDLINLRAVWEPQDGTSLFVIVRNAVNTDYAERADFTSFTGLRYFPGEDRAFTFGLRKEL